MPVAPPIEPLKRPVRTLWGVGPERVTQLARVGITTVEDLLLHRPRRYEDRRHFRPIKELVLGEMALTRGRAVALGVKWFKHHTRSVFELILDDGTARLHCRWWNLPFMEKYFSVGNEVVVFGKPLQLKPRTIDHPETEVVEGGEENFVHLNRITPIYPLTEGLQQRWLRGLIWRTLGDYEEYIDDPWPTEARVQSPATRPIELPARSNAVHMLHFPEDIADIQTARRRLALDEFVDLQKHIQIRRRNFEAKSEGLPCGGDNHLMRPFLTRLGFKLTRAQTEVLRQLRKDMSGAHPMRRLLQGDVGSGKTVVSACCALMALESGYNVALMAPTEILAEQHFQNLTRWFEGLGVGVGLQTGSRKIEPVQTDRKSPVILAGTHALFAAGVEVPDLGLVIIDEQHKFGVAQREQLLRKGRYPHLLVMTATPIPRTLGLTLYGELNLSVIDELPPGRGRIKTFVRTGEQLPKVWKFIREKLEEGRQAYVVYPRVEDAGAAGVKAVTKELGNLQKAFAPFKVAMMHGQMKAADKEQVMAGFRANQVQVLLATSLIEVGVDVANATIMLIENAEQFGLAQLHQLRGRVGRGGHDSWCILIRAGDSEEALERLKVLEETNDGFKIAEADLKLRGPGELLGQQQSGVPNFRFGDLREDWDLILEARRIASVLIDQEKGS